MATPLNVSTPTPFQVNTDPSRLATAWTKWKAGFDIYIAAAGINEASQKKALLLHCGGEGIQTIFETLTIEAPTDDIDVFKRASEGLTAHFAPQKNKRYERHLFHLCVQTEAETMSQWVTKLKTLAKSCEYTDVDDAIIDQVIEKCKSSKLRKTLLKTADLTLNKLLEVSLITETVSRQSKNYDSSSRTAQPQQVIVSDDEADHVNSLKYEEDHVNQMYHQSRRGGRGGKKHQKSQFVRSQPQVNSNNSNSGNKSNNNNNKPLQSILKPQSSAPKKEFACFRCGSSDHLAHECTETQGKACYSCGKIGHLSRVCKSKPVPLQQQSEKSRTPHRVAYIAPAESDEASSSDDDDWVLAIDTKVGAPPKKKHNILLKIFYFIIFIMKFLIGQQSADGVNAILPDNLLHPIVLNSQIVPVLIDSGSSANILSQEAYERISSLVTLLPHKRPLYPYMGKKSLPISGKIKVNMISNGFEMSDVVFLVIPDAQTSILGRSTAEKFQLLRVGPDDTETAVSPGPIATETISELSAEAARKEDLGEFEDRGKGLGCLKDAQGNFIKVKIHRDDSVHPKMQRSQRFPPKQQKQIEHAVEALIQEDVIEKMHEPPTWLNPLIPVEKPDGSGIRLCVDMRAANTAVIREPYQIPTIEEISQTFKGCKYFTKLDLNKGYHQILLDEASRDLTAFQCHLGIFRYKRLNFGLSSAAEIYQREMELALMGIPFQRNISDDIIIGGRTKSETRLRHKAVLKRLRERNITINLAKSKFVQESVLYMGHILSAEGISPDQTRVLAINSLKAPTNVPELQSFLGMVTYCSKFLPNFSTITDPLRKLLKKNTPWVWSDAQQQAFQELKDLLLSSKTLAFFDPSAYTEVITDASPVGLGAVILQRQPDGRLQPVDYASRALTGAETRYSQIERESLGIYFAITRFRSYLYGMEFTVKTDHKPLVSLFKTYSKPPPRIENWIIRLMAYSFTVVYQPGKENGADYLSRSNPLKTKDERSYHGDDYINTILQHQLPKSIPTKTLQEETKKDKVLQCIVQFLLDGNFDRNNIALKPFFANRYCFSYVNNLLLYNNRIVIPKSLRNKTITLAHEGHQGMTKTVSRLRRTVWWPRMKSEVELFVAGCHNCQVVGALPLPTPLQMTDIPERSWLMVGCDLCGPFPSGESLLVCVDYHSRYPEVEIVRSVKTATINNRLRKMFCRYGPPEVLVTDNGPQFISSEFKALMQEFNIKHRRVTPYHPIANGEVERFNRSLKKCIQTAISEGMDWRVVLQNFLLNYRTTPHSTTGVSPADLFFGRRIRDKLPSSPTAQSCSGTKPAVQIRDSVKKQKMKNYADEKRRAASHNILVGQQVLVTNNTRHRNKYTPRWDTSPGMVTGVKGNSIFLTHKGKNIMRSSSQVKIYRVNAESPNRQPNDDTDESSSDSEYEFHEREEEISDTETVPYELGNIDNNGNNEPVVTINQQWVNVDENNIISDRRTRGISVHTDSLVPSKFR